MRRSRFFLNSFLRFVAAAGFPVSGLASGAVFFCCSFATCCSVSWCDYESEILPVGAQYIAPLQPGEKPKRQQSCRTPNLALLADDLLLGCHCAAARTLAGTGIGVCPLAAHRQVTAVADSAVGLNFDQPADVHLDLLAEIAFHAAFLLDGLAEMVDFIFGQVADLFRVIDAGFSGEFFRAFLADAVNRGQTDPETFLHRKIHTCYACHALFLLKSKPFAATVTASIVGAQHAAPLPARILTLALFVLGVAANYTDYPAPVNHLALVANFLNRCPYLHADCSSPAAKYPQLQDLLPRPASETDLPDTLDATCTGTRFCRALNRTAKARRLLCRPPECG